MIVVEFMDKVLQMLDCDLQAALLAELAANQATFFFFDRFVLFAKLYSLSIADLIDACSNWGLFGG